MLERVENKTGWVDIERPVAAKIIKESIVRHSEVYAVTNAKGQTSSIFKKISFDRNADFIKISKSKEDKIEIEIYLLLYFGVPISLITRKIIMDIRDNLAKYLSLSPDKIEIHVVGLKTKKSIVERNISVKG